MRLPYLPACDAFVCESGAQYMPYIQLRASSRLGPQQETHTRIGSAGPSGLPSCPVRASIHLMLAPAGPRVSPPPSSPGTGGRIFYPGCHLPTACPLREDEGWRLLQGVAGPANQDVVEPEERKVGPMGFLSWRMSEPLIHKLSQQQQLQQTLSPAHTCAPKPDVTAAAAAAAAYTQHCPHICRGCCGHGIVISRRLDGP